MLSSDSWVFACVMFTLNSIPILLDHEWLKCRQQQKLLGRIFHANELFAACLILLRQIPLSNKNSQPFYSFYDLIVPKMKLSGVELNRNLGLVGERERASEWL